MNLLQYAQALDPLVEARPRATEREVAEAESRLGLRFPDEVRRFFLLSNGASLGVRLSSDEVEQAASPLVMSLGEIVEAMESVPMEANDRVLVFGAAGADGIAFGHPIGPTGTVRSAVVAWWPVESRIATVAPSFAAWLDGWLSGTITV